MVFNPVIGSQNPEGFSSHFFGEPFMANVCFFTGRLTRDPEIRSFATGDRVVKFAIATDRRVKNKDTGEWEKQSEFVDLEAWNGQADVINTHFKKGDSIVISNSEFTVDRWEKDGQKRSRPLFKVRDFEFPGGKAKREEPVGATAGSDAGEDDSLPF